MAVVPAISPERKRVRGGILDAARDLPDDIPESVWRHQTGISYEPVGCGPAYIIDDCVDDPVNGFDLTRDVPPPVTFKPFMVVYPDGCNVVGGLDRAEKAQAGLRLHVSAQVARQLSRYTAGVFPTTMADVAKDVSSTTPGGNDVVDVLAGLIQEMNACGHHGEITFHAPAWSFPYFKDRDMLDRQGDVWFHGQHRVSFDAGYANEAPALDAVGDPNPAAGTVAVAGSFWVYATSTVEIGRGAVTVDPPDLADQIYERRNDIHANAFQFHLFRFDPCCVFAARGGLC